MSSKFIKLIAISISLWLVLIDPVRADFCRQVGEQRICIIKIDRSAKNYWQYRASVRIDGVAKPAASYDCRDRLIVEPDGNTLSFRSRPDGGVVCSLYHRR